ncbi:MAG: LTA synthase family protein [Odoribacteraceae bacterium]|jgi:phosphoglycerol transferase MdoB-like AlkP superfamily enzyme|nr:LTA synthase family protein [Odoribacteraceae bacterium]
MRELKFLRPLIYFFGAGLFIMTASRLALFLLFRERITQTEGYPYLFLVGLRFDIIVMSYLSVLPALLSGILPGRWLPALAGFLRIYCPALLILALFLELSTPSFIHQYDTRPNRLFLEYLIYPREVIPMLLKGRPWSLLLVGVTLAAVVTLFIKRGRYLFRIPSARAVTRLLVTPFLFLALLAGARGSLVSKRPVNASNAVFSNDQMTNSIALNSTYTVLHAVYSLKHEASPSKMYGKMEEEEAYRRVKKYMNVSSSLFTDPEIPLLHRHPLPASDTSTERRPRNVVIFLQESLGAEFVGCLGGMPLTPGLDKWSQAGCLFTRLYCTGTRSVRGIEAVISGFLPSPSESVVKLDGARTGFATIARVLQRHGYRTSFIYGGMSNFDNMGAFFNGNGFDRIIDERDFDTDGRAYALKGTWGYSDEDLVQKANDYFKSLGDAPFFSLLFSTSNHEPFEFPDGRIELFEQPKNTVHNAIKYADYCIDRFLELASGEEYFKNTIFLIVADHNTRTYGKNLVPLPKFRIPALLLGPGVPAGTRHERLASQIDLPTTLLGLAGIETEHPMPGRDLSRPVDTLPGRALMQFMEINAFRVEEQVVILQPDREPLQFRVVNDSTLLPAPLDPELARDALAHVVAAEFLYKNKRYRLKEERDVK